jgi:hypothetical protein
MGGEEENEIGMSSGIPYVFDFGFLNQYYVSYFPCHVEQGVEGITAVIHVVGHNVEGCH